VFEIGQIYRRADIHHEYSGQEQGGIVTPRGQPFIFLVTGEGGAAHGYADGWEDEGTFRYYGEGQVGDMQFVRGNAALRDHVSAGKDLHLFEKTPPAHWRYLGQMVCAGYDLVPDSPDSNGDPRVAIVFRLVSLDGSDATGAVPDSSDDQIHPEDWYWGRDLEELRAAALEAPSQGASSVEKRRRVYHRSMAVKTYVLRRAEGVCEGCGEPAPFVRADGRPYLEPHHTRRISDGGPDHPAWVVAVCPTCHRRAHHAVDREEFNATLVLKANALEGDVTLST
jgi:5-methylcytosine-specific restriction protein A